MVSPEWHWKLSLGLRTYLHTYVCICTHTSKTQETTAKRNSQVARMHSRSGLGIKLEFFSFVYYYYHHYYYLNESSSGLGWPQIECMANNFELLSSYFRIQSTKIICLRDLVYAGLRTESPCMPNKQDWAVSPTSEHALVRSLSLLLVPSQSEHGVFVALLLPSSLKLWVFLLRRCLSLEGWAQREGRTRGRHSQCLFSACLQLPKFAFNQYSQPGVFGFVSKGNTRCIIYFAVF